MRFFILTILTICAAFASEFQERLDIDPAIQGVWIAHSMSTDKGSTWKDASVAVARARASSVTVDGGDVYRVSKVMIAENDGVTGNAIFFSNANVSYYVFQPVARGPFIVQVFPMSDDGVVLPEKCRFIITVE